MPHICQNCKNRYFIFYELHKYNFFHITSGRLSSSPIGLVIDDIQSFEEKSRFAYGRYTDFVKGTYIYNLEDFEKFISDLKCGLDPSYKDRQCAIKMFCQYLDFDSTKRVCDFIERKLIEI